MTLQGQFGQIDIYLFDQLLHGRLRPGMRVLDAGCGGGRNLVYLLPDGSECYLVSADRLLDLTRRLGGTLLDPLKTTLVHDQRSMTTWVVGK